MKSLILLLLLFILSNSCAKKDVKKMEQTPVIDTHTSSNSIDWAGTYSGVIPCADCAGIELTIKLTSKGTYVVQGEYIGKADSYFTKSGSFSWSETGNEITLVGIENEPNRYLVHENKLVQLDLDGKLITGEFAKNYILNKQELNTSDTSILDFKWKLVELQGEEIEYSNPELEIYFSFDVENNKISGYSGCNRFMGTYLISGFDRIKFEQLLSTKKACPEMPLENEFMFMLNQVDNYSILGGTLSLNKAKMAAWARFVKM